MGRNFGYTLNKMGYIFLIMLFIFFPFSRAGINILAGLIFIVVVSKSLLGKGSNPFIQKPILPLLALVGAGLLSLINAVDIREGIETIASPWLKFLAIYVATSDCITSERQLRNLLAVMLFGGLVGSVIGMHQYFNLSITRIMSFFTNPNPAGTYFVMITLLSISLLFSKQEPRVKLFLILNTVAAVTATLLTFSRGAIMGLFGSLIILILLLSKQIQYRKTIIGIIFFMLIVFFLAPEQLGDRFGSIVDNSGMQRIYLFVTGWEMYLEHPLIGTGIGNFRLVYPEIKPEGAQNFSRIHNVVMQIMAETGTLGILAYLWLCYTIIKFNLKTTVSRINDTRWAVSSAVVLCLIAVNIHGLVDHTLFNDRVGLLLFALAGLSISTARIYRKA